MTYILLNFCKMKDNSSGLIELLWWIYWEQCPTHRKHIISTSLYFLLKIVNVYKDLPAQASDYLLHRVYHHSKVSEVQNVFNLLSTSSSSWLPRSQCQAANLTLIPQPFLLLRPKFWLSLTNSTLICSFLSKHSHQLCWGQQPPRRVSLFFLSSLQSTL